jgi:CrcB protein
MQASAAVAVFVGGGLGSLARHGLQLAAAAAFGSDKPIGTWLVNVLGSLFLGAVLTATNGSDGSALWRLALGTGLMGGFTTYSTFNAEALAYLQRGLYGSAALYIAATVASCLGAGFAGHWATRAVLASAATG